MGPGWGAAGNILEIIQNISVDRIVPIDKVDVQMEFCCFIGLSCFVLFCFFGLLVNMS